MIISGRYIKDAPYIPARVVVGQHEGVVWFLADCGAARTVIFDRTLDDLRIASSLMEPMEGRLVGIGGSVRGFLLRNTQMMFLSDRGEFQITFDLAATKHDLEQLPPDEALRLSKLPSVLGRDIINQFEFCCDYEAGTVSLKKRK